MIFTLEALRAKRGDCLLLHWGDAAAPRFAIIDGGPKGTYRESLQPRIDKLRKARVADDVALEAEFAMVSHIDEDHIFGLVDLTNDMIRVRDSGAPDQLRIRTLWHNAFEDLVGAPPAVDPAELDSLAESADKHEVAAAAFVVASVNQGSKLRDNARALGIALNDPLRKLIAAPATVEPPEFFDGLHLTIIAPDAQRVADLQKAWELERREDGHIPELVVSAHDDPSVPNMSSIVVLAEFEKRKILLTGDARGDLTLTALEQAGLLKPKGTMEVDIYKVQHHGSSHNCTEEDFRRVRAKHYVFSADSTDGNPDVATLDMVLAARPAPDDDFTLHFTYDHNVEQLEAKIKAAGRTIRVEVAPKPPMPQPWIGIDLLEPLGAR